MDSKLPDLTALMTKIPNSRNKWFAERCAIEAISRNKGEPNLFATVNMEVKNWEDVRRLVYQLEIGEYAVFHENWDFVIPTNSHDCCLSIHRSSTSIFIGKPRFSVEHISVTYVE